MNGQSRLNWTCATENQNSSAEGFEDAYDNFGPTGLINVSHTGTGSVNCVRKTLYLDNNSKKTQNPTCITTDPEGCSCTIINENSYYKTISSYILHTSPTDAEFGGQVSSMLTPSLPIDKERYIDFIGAKG